MTKTILLTQNKVALVDDLDYENLCLNKWVFQTRYAVRYDKSKPVRKFLYMHREIMQTPPGMSTDHINHNTLDNRRVNLRICTHSQNCQNRIISNRNTSGFKGVSWIKKSKIWCAQIKANNSIVYLGFFKSPEDAARAYDNAARELFGEFAHTNF